MKNNYITLKTMNYFKSLIDDSFTKHVNIQESTKILKFYPQENKKYLLYIHIPFCKQLCPFCTFHKFIYNKKMIEDYYVYLEQELIEMKNRGFEIDSIYVGGGTPLIDKRKLKTLLLKAKELFNVSNISCETDIKHIDKNSLMEFKDIITRLSIGVQSFDEPMLKKMKRYGKSSTCEQLVSKIKEMQDIIPTINIDLMFNLPNQNVKMFQKDLKIAKSLKVNQITAYPLMQTSLNKNSINNAFKEEINNLDFLDYYNVLEKELETYHKINAWSYSNQTEFMSDEYVSSHEEYIGIGSGAFSFINSTLYVNAFDLNEYKEKVSTNKTSIKALCQFNNKEKVKYHLLIKLFAKEVNIQGFNKTFEVDIENILKKELYFAKFLGILKIKDGVIQKTKFGSKVFVLMMSSFYKHMDKVRAYFRNTVSIDKDKLKVC